MLIKPFKFFASIRNQIIIFSIFSLVFFIATIAMTAQVFLQIDKYRTTVNDNLRWSLTQMERDHLQFILALERLRPNNNASIENAKLRYDLLYSRVMSVQQGSTFEKAFPTTEPVEQLQSIIDTLSDVLPVVDADNQTFANQSLNLLSTFDQLTPLMRNLSLESIKAEARNVAQERSILASQLRQLAILSLLLLSALLALLYFLWYSARNQRQRSLEKIITLNRLQTILDTSLDAVLVVKKDGSLLECNLTAIELLGLTSDQIRSSVNIKNILYQNNDAQNLRQVFANTLFTACALGPIRSTEYMAKTTNLSTFPIELSAKIASTEGNTVCVCFLRDITRRLQAEDAVTHARDEALAGERAKARFLAVMSHEMRTPLQGIFGTLDLLEETKLSDEQVRHHNILQSSSTLLLNQVNDAVEMLRTGNTNVLAKSDSTFSFCQMVSEIVLSASPAAHKNNSKIVKVSSKRKIGIVQGDQDKLRQVLLNLLTNAAKFTINGTITIEAARVGAKDGDIIEIQITDTGIGIEKEDNPRIFDDYVQLNKETPEGSGLGLSITKQLVELMGGKIGVESEPGEGSVFWIRLPLPAVQQANPSTLSEAKQFPEAPIDIQKILLVEDNNSSRLVLEQMLNNDGHKVQSCSNGETAVEYAKIQHFDLIIMDINLPGLSGIETAAKIREDANNSDSPRIVFLTALAALDTSSSEDQKKAEEIYTKPLRKDGLRAMVMQKNTPDRKTAVFESIDFDAQTFNQFRQTLDKHEFSLLLKDFRHEANIITAQLQNFEGHTTNELAYNIHKLAGSCAVFGAHKMQATLNRAETAIMNNDLDAARNELGTLPEAWDSACIALDKLQNQTAFT